MLVEELKNLCQLCTTENELDSTRESEDIDKITSLFNFEIDQHANICENCFIVLYKFYSFSERCMKAKEFFEYLRSLDSLPDLTATRLDFGLQFERVNRSTDTNDLNSDCKSEFIDTKCHEGELAAFEELEDFEEISAIDLPETEVNQCNEIAIEQVDFKCEDGDESCNENSNKSDINFENIQFSCHLCEEKFANFYSLQSHCRKNHQSSPEVLCSCGALLNSRAQLLMHKKMHSSETIHSCKFCGKVYSHQQSLLNHVRKSHPKMNQSDFTCSNCPKTFENEKKLKAHEQVHLPHGRKYSSSCPYCDKKFTKSVNVQAHIRSVHQMQRPFLCCDCGKNFSTKGALKEHQIIHSDTFPFQCSICPKKFKNLPRLKTHEDIHNNTQYICNICGISLNTKRTLKMHMVVHSDQKNYKCQYCGSSFKRSKALKNHLILHSGLRPYRCMWCDKTFANGSNCRSHKKKAHPVELANYEASGKSTNSSLNIPRLDQLQPKTTTLNQQEPSTKLNVITTSSNDQQEIQEMPFDDIKQELPSFIIPTNSENFQIHHIIQSSNTILVDSQSQ